MNVWTFSGRCGADAELRTTQNGEKVLSFRVANDIGFGDRKTTQWVDCSVWGRRAESLVKHVKKGDKLVVSGELKLEEFQRRDGTPGSKLSVKVAELDLGSKGDGAHQGGGGGKDYGNDAPPPPSAKPKFDQDLDDEIPFISC